ncbi:hypothetical protein INR49_007751 [Caranx melampygus]|nr:hypothetical protein INR49_007751 [Caranx melampygus]
MEWVLGCEMFEKVWTSDSVTSAAVRRSLTIKRALAQLSCYKWSRTSFGFCLSSSGGEGSSATSGLHQSEIPAGREDIQGHVNHDRHDRTNHAANTNKTTSGSSTASYMTGLRRQLAECGGIVREVPFNRPPTSPVVTCVTSELRSSLATLPQQRESTDDPSKASHTYRERIYKQRLRLVAPVRDEFCISSTEGLGVQNSRKQRLKFSSRAIQKCQVIVCSVELGMLIRAVMMTKI